MRVLSACPACGSVTFTIVAELDAERRERFLAYSKRKYDGLLDQWIEDIPPVILRCGNCGHCWYQYQPDDERLARMYASGQRLLPKVPFSRKPSRYMLREMTRFRSFFNELTPNLLDYGSGYGRWARAAQVAGFRVTAFEPSASRGAETDVQFELVHNLDAISGRQFSAIQLEQVLEHTADPFAVLRGLLALCVDTTLIRITVPNILRTHEGSLIWEAWPYDGTTTHTMAPFEHLHGFTPMSLDHMLERAGFKSISMLLLLRHWPALASSQVLGGAIPAVGRTVRIMCPA
jgi:hypothetical protein